MKIIPKDNRNDMREFNQDNKEGSIMIIIFGSDTLDKNWEL